VVELEQKIVTTALVCLKRVRPERERSRRYAVLRDYDESGRIESWIKVEE
jgi:hypothetical protein